MFVFSSVSSLFFIFLVVFCVEEWLFFIYLNDINSIYVVLVLLAFKVDNVPLFIDFTLNPDDNTRKKPPVLLFSSISCRSFGNFLQFCSRSSGNFDLYAKDLSNLWVKANHIYYHKRY